MMAPRPERPALSGARARARRLEGALRTGSLAHLLGGSLDLLQALSRYALARVRGRRRVR
jgi:hypothetical protein